VTFQGVGKNHTIALEEEDGDKGAEFISGTPKKGRRTPERKSEYT